MNIPMPTKIGSLKWAVHLPQIGTIRFDPQLYSVVLGKALFGNPSDLIRSGWQPQPPSFFFCSPFTWNPLFRTHLGKVQGPLFETEKDASKLPSLATSPGQTAAGLESQKHLGQLGGRLWRLGPSSRLPRIPLLKTGLR